MPTRSLTTTDRIQLSSPAARLRLPTMFGDASFVEAGGLMSYGSNSLTSSGAPPTYVDRILKGAKPADLPVEQPTKFELVINLKPPRRSASTFPRSLLARADEVIE